MKKLLFLLAISATILLSSCDDTIEPVSDPKSATTIEIQEMAKDTMLVSVIDDRIIICNKDDNLVKYDYVNVKFSALVLAFVIGALGATLIFAQIYG